MIVQRLRKALNSQKWGAAVLELMIVVVGIFLGLQVDDWNERRKELQRESLYLDRIYADLSSMREELNDKIDRSEEAKKRMIAASAALEECNASDETRSDISFALERYQVVGPFNYLNATYDEMVASGALARIEDRELKQDITYAFSQLAELNANQRSMRVSMPVVDAIVWQAVSYSAEGDTGRPVVSYDFDTLCGNIELRNAIVEMIDIQWDTMTGANRVRESVEKVIARLDK